LNRQPTETKQTTKKLVARNLYTLENITSAVGDGDAAATPSKIFWAKLIRCEQK